MLQRFTVSTVNDWHDSHISIRATTLVVRHSSFEPDFLDRTNLKQLFSELPSFKRFFSEPPTIKRFFRATEFKRFFSEPPSINDSFQSQRVINDFFRVTEYKRFFSEPTSYKRSLEKLSTGHRTYRGQNILAELYKLLTRTADRQKNVILHWRSLY